MHAELVRRAGVVVANLNEELIDKEPVRLLLEALVKRENRTGAAHGVTRELHLIHGVHCVGHNKVSNLNLDELESAFNEGSL